MIRCFYFIAILLSFTLPSLAAPADGRVDIWPRIPFLRGADLCQYQDAYSQTRSQYMKQMVGYASQLMGSGAYGFEALDLLVAFNGLYDQNLELATKGAYLDVTLDSTLKAYLDSFYRDIKPRQKQISFTEVNDLLYIVDSMSRGQKPDYLDENRLLKLDYIAYGTYSYAPDCKGDILVTLHLLGRDGETKSYLAHGRPATVMSQIASRMFEDFQRTSFPSKLKIGANILTLIGGLNGSVDQAPTPKIAQQACETLGARLPTEFELDIANAYGDWSGGVSLVGKYWAMKDNMVFAPNLRNPTPVREMWEVNAESYHYYCVQ